MQSKKTLIMAAVTLHVPALMYFGIRFRKPTLFLNAVVMGLTIAAMAATYLNTTEGNRVAMTIAVWALGHAGWSAMLLYLMANRRLDERW